MAVWKALARCAAMVVLLGAVAASAAGIEAPALRIGVAAVPPKADVPTARLYTQDGFELDLADEIGRRLGRKVERVAVGEDAAAALAAGRIDLAVTRQQAAAPGLELLPSGYESGLSVAMRADTDIRDWSQLAGRTVCVVAANERARHLIRARGGREVVEPVPALTLMKVRTGECDAAIHDEAVLDRLFGEPEWKKFSATLPARDATRLAVLAPTGRAQTVDMQATLAALADSSFWDGKIAEWAKDVALEVYLEQDAPDCH